jgi:hypothetical protein
LKILKNFDAKKIAKAKNKILFASGSVVFFVLLICSSAFREFVSNHPGLIAVLIGVSGEVYFDWKEERGEHARWKKLFMALLIVGLTYELYEASESDKKAADAIKVAGRANERASSNEWRVAELNKETADAKLQLAETKDRIRKEVEPISSVTADLKIEIDLDRPGPNSRDRVITTPVSENEDLSSATLDVSFKNGYPPNPTGMSLPLHFIAVKSRIFQYVPLEGQYNKILISFDLERSYSARAEYAPFWLQSDDIFGRPAELIGLVDVVKVKHLFSRPLKGAMFGKLTIRFNSLPRTFSIGSGAFSNDFTLTALAATNASEIIRDLAK